MNKQSVAIHEAGHAIGYLAHDIQVTFLYATATRGLCRPQERSECDPAAELLILDAGAGAEQYFLGEADDYGARFDRDAARQCLAYIDVHGITPDIRGSNAMRFIAYHHDEVACLANELEKLGALGVDGLSKLVHRDASPLAAFRHLYGKPVPVRRPSPMATAGLSRGRSANRPQRVTFGGGIFGNG